MTNLDLQKISGQIAYITINPRGNFLKSAQLGFKEVGLYPGHLIYVKPSNRLMAELKKHKLSFFTKFLLPQLKKFAGNKKSFSNEVVDIKINKTHVTPKLNSETTKQLIKANNIKYLVNCGAGIFRKQIIDIPGLIILNAHAGKLPEYKNMNVVEWAICNGDPVVGTVHRIDAGIDTGPVWYQQEIDITGKKDLIQAREHCFDQVIKMVGKAVIANEMSQITERYNKPNEGKKWYRMHSFYQKKVNDILNK